MMTVTRLAVRKALVEYGLAHKTNAEIDAAMADVDQQAIIAAERAKYSIEVWDRQTPINGVDAARVMEIHAIPAHGTAYMIREAGRIVYFQAHDPHTGAVITAENAQEVANRHLDEFAASRAEPIIIEAVVDRLDA